MPTAPTPVFRPCVVIPTYDNPATIAAVVDTVRTWIDDVIVVDDGSSSAAQTVLDGLVERVDLVRRLRNGGKGAAVKDGLARALARGFTNALQVDADGQHDLEMIPQLLRAAERAPAALVMAQPVFDESAPKGRLFARKITRFWTRVETGSDAVGDPMCGFRVYPVSAAIAADARGDRMDFDIEIAVRMAWRGVPIVHLPTRVRYLTESEGGVSHFRLVVDNAAISATHSTLVLTRWWRQLTGAAPVDATRHPSDADPTEAARLADDEAWLRVAERGTVIGIRALLWVSQRLGRAAARRVVDAVIAYYVATAPDARAASRAWLEHVASARVAETGRAPAPVGLREVYEHFRRFGHVTLDRLLFAQAETEGIHFESHGREAVLRHLDAGRGVLMIGAHLGSFEAIHRLGTRRGLKINILAHVDNARMINATLEALGSSTHARLIALGEGRIDGVLEAADALRRGEIVALLGDRVGIGGRTVEVDFLGARARFPAGPIHLAAILKCPVVLAFGIFREPATYELHIEAFAEPFIKLPRGRARDAAVTEWVARYAERLGARALDAPDNWFNFYDFFAKTP